MIIYLSIIIIAVLAMSIQIAFEVAENYSISPTEQNLKDYRSTKALTAILDHCAVNPTMGQVVKTLYHSNESYFQTLYLISAYTDTSFNTSSIDMIIKRVEAMVNSFKLSTLEA